MLMISRKYCTEIKKMHRLTGVLYTGSSGTLNLYNNIKKHEIQLQDLMFRLSIRVSFFECLISGKQNRYFPFQIFPLYFKRL